jgi:hypothetical protein
MKRICLALALLSLPLTPRAGQPGVYKLTAPMEVGAAYDRIYKALEAEKIWVVLESNVGEQMARKAAAWGVDYNRNRLGAIKGMVFCNIEWTNRLANADPDLLALCPMHLTVYERDGATYVVFARLSVMAQGSPGASTATELEAVVRGIVEGSLKD